MTMKKLNHFFEIMSVSKPANANDILLNDARNSLMRRIPAGSRRGIVLASAKKFS